MAGLKSNQAVNFISSTMKSKLGRGVSFLEDTVTSGGRVRGELGFSGRVKTASQRTGLSGTDIWGPMKSDVPKKGVLRTDKGIKDLYDK